MVLLTGFVAFISEYLDSSLGMGYGTALAPILILMGYHPLKVAPAILISQLMTDIAACIFHHNLRNVDLKFASQDFKIASLLGITGAFGASAAVILAFKIPSWLLTLYIGLLISAMGIFILVTLKKAMGFSWPKITALSLVASFNKGISGGGYGPLIMGGQMLSSVNAKNAVGITAFAEAVTCLAGFVSYLIAGKSIDWKLIDILVVSAVPAVPLAAVTVKKTDSFRLKKLVGMLITILGLLTLMKISR